jgi:hypothetical protein
MSSTYYGNLARKEMKASISPENRVEGELKRATYYLRPDQIKALKLRAVLNDESISSIVRAALDAHLSPGRERTTQRAGKEDDFLFCSK